jgi:hypothetical protein
MNQTINTDSGGHRASVSGIGVLNEKLTKGGISSAYKKP